MSVQIRSKGEAMNPHHMGVTALLANCHSRIRSFLAAAERLASGEGEPAQRVESAQKVAFYFREIFPLHATDEDELIVPALRAAGLDVGPYATLNDDHQRFDRAMLDFAPLWDEWAKGSTIEASAAHREQLREISEGILEHIAREEENLLPRVDELPEDVRADIQKKMLAKRAHILGRH